MTIENFINILPYFIFGFISAKTWMLIAPSKEHKASEIYLEILVYGTVYKLLYEKLQKLDFSLNVMDEKYSLSLISVILISVAVPFILKNTLNSRIVSKYIVNTVSPSGWDYFFSKGEVCFAIVYLKGEEEPIIGYYGENSFASSYPKSQDVYLEAIYELKSDGTLEENPKENTKGIYLKGENIRKIEFQKI